MNFLTSSKRFWVAVAAAASIYFQDRIGLSADTAHDLVLVAGTWILGDSLRATDSTKTS